MIASQSPASASTCWHLRNASGTRRIICRLQPHPGGTELLVELDGAPYYTQVGANRHELQSTVRSMLETMQAMGWEEVLAPGTSPSAPPWQDTVAAAS